MKHFRAVTWGDPDAYVEGMCACIFVMTLRKRLKQKGVSNTQIAFIAQGFVELLEDQLELSSQKAHQAATALKNGKISEAVVDLQAVGKTMSHADLSQNTALLLIKQDSRERR